MREAKALTRLRGCAGPSELSLLADVINTKISFTGQIDYLSNSPGRIVIELSFPDIFYINLCNFISFMAKKR